MFYRISVTERGLTGIPNIFRSRLSRLDDLLGAGTVPLNVGIFRQNKIGLIHGFCGCYFIGIGLVSVSHFPENGVATVFS